MSATGDTDDRISGDENMPETCLSFTVSGPWGHFKRIEGSVAKQTYRIMPRTTISGLCAGIIGYDRDSYYSVFSMENADIAITPESSLRTMNMPVQSLSTTGTSHSSDEENDMLDLTTGTVVSVKVPNPNRMRQRFNYEVLVEPSYRIDIRVQDKSTYNTLKSRLQTNTATYPPSLGVSEYLADIEYHGEYEIGSLEKGVHDIRSAIPNNGSKIIPQPGIQYRTERSPGAMELSGEGNFSSRQTSEFVSYSYTATQDPVTIGETSPSVVDGRIVMFS